MGSCSFKNDGTIEGEFEYNTDIFDNETISRFADHYATVLQDFLANPSQPVSEMQILTSEERHRMLYSWNDTETPLPLSKGVHHLFEVVAPQAEMLGADERIIERGLDVIVVRLGKFL